MTGQGIIDACRGRGIELSASGDRLRFRPSDISAELVTYLTQHKPAILAALRVDGAGHYHCADGDVYAPTDTGGWILVERHGRPWPPPPATLAGWSTSHARTREQQPAGGLR